MARAAPVALADSLPPARGRSRSAALQARPSAQNSRETKQRQTRAAGKSARIPPLSSWPPSNARARTNNE